MKNFRTLGHKNLKQRNFELFLKSEGFYSLRSDPDPVFFRGWIQIRIRSKWTGSANTDRIRNRTIMQKERGGMKDM
jgi:hypothetical protein